MVKESKYPATGLKVLITYEDIHKLEMSDMQIRNRKHVHPPPPYIISSGVFNLNSLHAYTIRSN